MVSVSRLSNVGPKKYVSIRLHTILLKKYKCSCRISKHSKIEKSVTNLYWYLFTKFAQSVGRLSGNPNSNSGNSAPPLFFKPADQLFQVPNPTVPKRKGKKRFRKEAHGNRRGGESPFQFRSSSTLPPRPLPKRRKVGNGGDDSTADRIDLEIDLPTLSLSPLARTPPRGGRYSFRYSRCHPHKMRGRRGH